MPWPHDAMRRLSHRCLVLSTPPDTRANVQATYRVTATGSVQGRCRRRSFTRFSASGQIKATAKAIAESAPLPLTEAACAQRRPVAATALVQGGIGAAWCAGNGSGSHLQRPGWLTRPVCAPRVQVDRS